MRFRLSRYLKRRTLLLLSLTSIALFFVTEFPPRFQSDNTEDDTLNVGLNSIKKDIVYEDPDFIPDFTQDLDLVKLSAWGYKPKNTWHQYYQHLFRKYNMNWTRNSYPEIKCDKKFEETLDGNMEVISNYPLNVPEKYLEELSLDEKGIEKLSKPVLNPRKYPVFVTAASSNHYKESQGMIKTYHQLLNIHPDLKLIYFDIGLTDAQRTELSTYCKCEVRIYESSKYPPHAAEKRGFAWKPILIQTVLKEYDLVMWMDASVVYEGTSLDEVSFRTRQRGIQAMHGAGAVCERTSKISFDFLKEDPCLFNLPEVEATWIVISRNRFTLEYLMKPWVSCGLTYNCMTFKNSNFYLGCIGNRKFHRCHRFDQSILGIIINRLFHEQRRVVEFDVAPVLHIQRNAQSHYFEQLKKQLK
ncbi:uncharacterized protein LOC132550837 [Ylistrum balloti]|uniref:uncharacterized protein LOC132550837 n=1 Tax=Ylistrum balloti TaxID=509963 RepID=UPI002905883C|nr:uncharacterized protein LOC132550837 [Ylistrum balloti]